MYMIREDGKVLADYRTFKIDTNVSFSKDKKHALVGITQGYGAECDVLAYFSDEKAAHDELNKIFEAIKEGRTHYTIAR